MRANIEMGADVKDRMRKIESLGELHARLADSAVYGRAQANAAGLLKAGTMDAYVQRARRAVEIVKPRTGGLVEVLLSPGPSYKELEDALRPREPNGSQKPLANVAGAMVAVLTYAKLSEDLRSGGQFARGLAGWKAVSKLASEAVQKQRETSEPTARQERAHVGWDVVHAKNDELWEAASEQMRAKRTTDAERLAASRAVDAALLSSLYVDMDPRRADLWRVFLVCRAADKARVSEEPAYLDVTPSGRGPEGRPRLFIKEFKTSRWMGAFDIELPERTATLLKWSLELRARAYLFGTPEGPYKDSTSFTAFHNRRLKAWFRNKAVSNNMLRHSFASWSQNDPSQSGQARALAAHNMAHSAAMNQQYAFKPRMTVDGNLRLLIKGAGRRPEPHLCVPEAKMNELIAKAAAAGKK